MEQNPSQTEPSYSHSPDGRAHEEVVFVGWQTWSSGEAVPLYNVMAENHPLYGSTVTDTTLQKNNLPVPPPAPRMK